MIAILDGLPLHDPLFMAMTDQIDLAYARARTPLADSLELSAMQETIRIRTNSVQGYLAAHAKAIPVLDTYLRGDLLKKTQELMRLKLSLLERKA